MGRGGHFITGPTVVGDRIVGAGPENYCGCPTKIKAPYTLGKSGSIIWYRRANGPSCCVKLFSMLPKLVS